MAAIASSRTISAAPRRCAEKGIGYIDVGTSGGVWGLERGYCMMIGGEKAAVDRLDPIFKTLAPGAGDISRTPNREKADPRVTEGYMHAGPAGAGHFVKMVHNGIEYGLMQAYAEGFDIMRGRNSDKLPEDERFDINAADVAEVWRRGSVVASWLLDLTAIALARSETLEEFSGKVDDSGEGRWTIQAAVDEAVAAPVITAALLCPLPFAQRQHLRRKASIGHAQGVRRPYRKHYPGPQGERRGQVSVLSHKSPPPPCAIVIFGANGDLTKRLIIPALYNLARTQLLPRSLSLIGVDHNKKTSEEWTAQLKDFLAQTLAKNSEEVDESLWQPGRPLHDLPERGFRASPTPISA